LESRRGIFGGEAIEGIEHGGEGFFEEAEQRGRPRGIPIGGEMEKAFEREPIAFWGVCHAKPCEESAQFVACGLFFAGVEPVRESRFFEGLA
jgi:hypothetical protein